MSNSIRVSIHALSVAILLTLLIFLIQTSSWGHDVEEPHLPTATPRDTFDRRVGATTDRLTRDTIEGRAPDRAGDHTPNSKSIIFLDAITRNPVPEVKLYELVADTDNHRWQVLSTRLVGTTSANGRFTLDQGEFQTRYVLAQHDKYVGILLDRDDNPFDTQILRPPKMLNYEVVGGFFNETAHGSFHISGYPTDHWRTVARINSSIIYRRDDGTLEIAKAVSFDDIPVLGGIPLPPGVTYRLYAAYRQEGWAASAKQAGTSPGSVVFEVQRPACLDVLVQGMDTPFLLALYTDRHPPSRHEVKQLGPFAVSAERYKGFVVRIVATKPGFSGRAQVKIPDDLQDLDSDPVTVKALPAQRTLRIDGPVASVDTKVLRSMDGFMQRITDVPRSPDSTWMANDAQSIYIHGLPPTARLVFHAESRGFATLQPSTDMRQARLDWPHAVVEVKVHELLELAGLEGIPDGSIAIERAVEWDDGESEWMPLNGWPKSMDRRELAERSLTVEKGARLRLRVRDDDRSQVMPIRVAR